MSMARFPRMHTDAQAEQPMHDERSIMRWEHMESDTLEACMS